MKYVALLTLEGNENFTPSSNDGIIKILSENEIFLDTLFAMRDAFNLNEDEFKNFLQKIGV